MEKLLQQAGDELATILCAAADIGDGRELGRENCQRLSTRLVAPLSTEQSALCELGSGRGRCNSTERHSDVAHDFVLIEFQNEARRDSGDIHLASLRDFVERAESFRACMRRAA